MLIKQEAEYIGRSSGAAGLSLPQTRARWQGVCDKSGWPDVNEWPNVVRAWAGQRTYLTRDEARACVEVGIVVWFSASAHGRAIRKRALLVDGALVMQHSTELGRYEPIPTEVEIFTTDPEIAGEP